MRAEQNSRRLERPGNHGPAPRQVNPFLSGISSEQSGQSKCEWDREARVTRIQSGRMDRHFRILQQRIEAASIGTRRQVQDSSGAVSRHHLKRAGDKIIHRQKENLYARQNHSHIRHQLRVFSPVRKKRREHINGKQETPEQQRTFLARPERGKFIVGRESPVTVGGHVGHRIIVGVEEIPEADGSDPDKHAHREAGIPRGFN